MDPYKILGIEESADDGAVQAAYSDAVRRSPPDRDPAGFQTARRAYELLKDTEARSRLRLFGHPQTERFEEMATHEEGLQVPVLGLGPWRALLNERKE